MRIWIAACVLAFSTPGGAVDLTDLWMACDLAQVDAGGDAPMASAIEQVSLVETPDADPRLRLLATTTDGDALYCEMDVEVATFRHNDQTIIERD